MNTLVKAAVLSKNLIAKELPEKADVFIICVPTPLDHNKKANLNYVKSAAESIVPYLEKENIVILESTVPPGTTDKILKPLLNTNYIAYCPERVLPGRILVELVENDRIIGGINQESAMRAKEMYECFVEGNIFITDSTTAEMVKLMENTYRDVNIALANEFAIISEKIGVNVCNAIDLANKHPRVNLHKPGPGIGGHCIAIDPYFIAEVAPESAEIIKLSRKINDSGPIVTIFGVAYKGNVDIELCTVWSYANIGIEVCEQVVAEHKINQ